MQHNCNGPAIFHSDYFIGLMDISDDKDFGTYIINIVKQLIILNRV